MLTGNCRPAGGRESRPLCRNRLLTGYNAAEPGLAVETVFWLSLVIVSEVTFGCLETWRLKHAMPPIGGIGWLLIARLSAFACGPGSPRTTSWDILSRPCGTRLGEFVYPGLTSWAIFSRPCGTRLGEFVYPGLTSWAIFSRPYGTRLGEFVYPGLTSWAIFSRPCATNRDTRDSRFVFSECCPNQPIECFPLPKPRGFIAQAQRAPGATPDSLPAFHSLEPTDES